MELTKHPMLRRLPKDLDQIATETGAIKRRRHLKGGEQLLWLALTYAGLPESFRSLSALATRAGCQLNDTSVRRRVKNSVEFLTEVLNTILFGAGRELRDKGVTRRIILQDATTVSAPGSKGTDWRVHTEYVLGQGLAHLKVTDSSVGESLRHGVFNAGDIIIADQGLATAQNFDHVRACGAHCIVRAYLKNLRVCDESGERLDLIKLLDQADQGIHSHRVLLPVKGKESIEGRLLIYQLSPEQTARNRQKLKQKASRNNLKVGELGLRLAGYFVLFTTIPEGDLSDDDIGSLYRLRWQIELFFKRAKSIVGLDELAAKTPDVARAYLLGKLIIVALTEKASMQLNEELRGDPRQYVSSWRLHHMCRRELMDVLREVAEREDRNKLEALRALGESPRKRKTSAEMIEKFIRHFNPGMKPTN